MSFLKSGFEWVCGFFAGRDLVNCLLIFVVVLLFVVLVFCIASNAMSEKITLAKRDWQCVKSEIITTPVMIGKVLVPMASEQCVEYKRND